MSLAVRASLGFAIACGLAYLATPGAIALAGRLHFHDEPTGYKGHLRPTPYLGGLAVMLGFFAAVLLTAGDWQRTAPLLGGAAGLLALGTADDRRPVPVAGRLGLEVAVGVAAWLAGVGWHLHVGGLVDLAFTCAWVVAVVNAFNLFDNMDGAAAAMGLVVSGGAAAIGIVHGDVWLSAAALSLCGACSGFLPRNLTTPARVFLGDGGSMPMGYSAAVLVMVAAGTADVAWRSLVIGLLLVGIPALDTCLVLVSRRRRGVSILTGGRDHLTHRAQKLLPDARSVVLLLAIIQVALCAVAVLASQGGATLLVLGASAYLLLAGTAIVILDTVEFEEFATAGAPEHVAALSGRRALVCLGVLGLGAGLSPFFFGFYDPANWVAIGLGVTLLAAVAIVMRPVSPTAPGRLCLGGLLGLALWALCSAAWSESVENAVLGANRWLVYGALLLLLMTLLKDERRALVLLCAAVLGITAVAVSVLVRLLGGDPGSLFVQARLNLPLGYVNGEGCLFAMGLWPLIAAAESRRTLLAALGAAGAAALACLVLLTQSRGSALAIVVSALLVCALTPGRVRRVYLLLVLGAAVALAAPQLLHIHDDAVSGVVSSARAHAGARAALLASLGAGVVWGLLHAAWQALARPGGARARSAASWALAIPLVVVILLGAASAGRVAHDAHTQWHAFVNLTEPGANSTHAPTGGNSRLLSGGGNRYDYWRVALKAWRSHPVLGVGEGNYARSYYEHRATGEDIDQPHSVELQVLSELGLPGAVLLLCFLAGAFWGAARMRTAASQTALSRGLMVSALGIFTVWAVQTSVDWIHLLPGVTAIALAAVAVLVAPHAARAREPAARKRTAEPARPVLRARSLALTGALIALVVAGASLTRQEIAQELRSRAGAALVADPAGALKDAERSLSVDPDATQTLYLKAAVLARLNRAHAAEATLREALRREPRNFVTWALLGDVAVRQERITQAGRYYARAHELNPRDAVLRALARDPGSAKG